MKKTPPPASDAIVSLEPYTSARMLNALSPDGVYLDANEAPRSFGFPPVDLGDIRHYADDKASLEEAYASYAGRKPDDVLGMRGVDEAVDLVIRAFCEPKEDSILTFTPTYGGYAAAAAAHRVELQKMPFGKDSSFDVETAARSGARVIFLCRPNNPTGSVASLADVQALAEAVPDRTVVAVDEAYIEFTEEASALTLLDRYPNIIIMRTMSKAFGLAGAHVGFTIAHPDVTDAMKKIINPYPLPDPCIQLAMASLGSEGLAFLKEAVGSIRQTRDSFSAKLEKHSRCLELLPSETSFLAGRFEDAQGIYERLRAEKIFIRPLAPMYGEGGWLRFTIGTTEEMDRIAAILGL
ncbi:aminotransferase class I/II-fold pyridoxal phosphate-dependent enzyme [Parvularcula sp. ZS-1/3]|uniref:Aminotransferase class I/II-fold pyridoxal phosphate-dependent enzyme n=1 Tax=Parvularcula mediterranea TaxID=2732508 RepID=A0A7Y3RL74_9PROT|nr:aminotransferase class I/II-fold pyridoxal phosphate-dependent enzyme [Parvularcula mediterranea]NNU16142.1 aminotransferase class I/II-fold pyridoxal phosphate-dependent enzyme [Parvularcula mediterranea]